MGVKELLGMSEKERFQLSLDLANEMHRHLLAPFQRAMRETNRQKSDLLRVMIETWLENFENQESPGPDDRPKSGQHASFKAGPTKGRAAGGGRER